MNQVNQMINLFLDDSAYIRSSLLYNYAYDKLSFNYTLDQILSKHQAAKDNDYLFKLDELRSVLTPLL